MMTDENTLMRVKAKRKVIYELGKELSLAIIPRCPFCKKRHQHGWGSGIRGSHCKNIGGRSYFIVCREEPTVGEKVWTRLYPILAKAPLWFELKIMLPVLYKLSSHGVRW